MNYLIDTCIISDFFKKDPFVIKHFESTSPSQIFISSLTVMEIEYGLKLKPEREKKIRPLWIMLLKNIQVLAYSVTCAIETSALRTYLKNEGLPIGPYDILIAGTALAHNMVVVTSNCKEFKRIPNLVIEDWKQN